MGAAPEWERLIPNSGTAAAIVGRRTLRSSNLEAAEDIVKYFTKGS